MPLIQKKEETLVQIRFKMTESAYKEIQEYMAFAELGDDFELFFNESAKYVMHKDRDYKAFKKEKSRSDQQAKKSTGTQIDQQSVKAAQPERGTEAVV